MRIFAIISGEYGARHVANISQHAPKDWTLETWKAPMVYPPVIDYPEDHLPAEFPSADLILSFAEHRGVAELLPDIARLTAAQAVIAPVDSEVWLPRGLARQLRGWMERMGVVCVTPKPMCSLTPQDYGVTRRQRIRYSNALISEFASYFGQPKLMITIDADTRLVSSVDVQRDAVCGCARFVAQSLIGISADDAEYLAGMAHHHYPCLASMGIDSDFNDTLMHVSGNILRDNVAEQVKPYKDIQYISPGTRSEQDNK